jgi:hypothetical protein
LPALEEHPFLPVLSEEEIAGLALQADGAAQYAEWLRNRNRLLRLAETQPLSHGFEPDAWRLADAQVRTSEVTAVFGANRTTKSWWAGKRFCEAALAYPGSVLVALSEKDEASIATQQKIVWHYLEARIKHLNNKRHPIYKVNYTQANGFTDGKLVLENRTEIYFLTYKTAATDYEGWEFGARLKRRAEGAGRKTEDGLSMRLDGSPIENIAWWADESLTWGWLEVLSRRSPFRQAKGIWTFTPVRGITPGIKQFMGTARVLESAPAELLPKARIEGCPAGHMPTVVQPAFHRASRAVYFHLGANPFGTYTQDIRDLCSGKSEEFIERIGYGYARDSVARAFPGFTGVNVVPVSQLPAKGTLYQFTDPHGTRPYASIWVLATPGKEPAYYVVRDFPDAQTYGEWAIPTERETSEDTRKGWDGDAGPAQNPLGWGVAEYKRCWLSKERRVVSGQWSVVSSSEVSGSRGAEDALALSKVKYAWHVSVIRAAIEAGGDLPESLQERLRERFMDPRFCAAEYAGDHGTTCLKWEFEKEQRDRAGTVIAAKMNIRPASGKDIQHGLSLITDLLAWNHEQDFMPGINAPRLFVSEECRQVIWALSNYTGRGGESGACKEWIDLLRHLAEEAPLHVEPGPVATRGAWGGYG